jgi:hypothetical protein
MVAHACNYSTREAEVGGWQIQGQPRLYTDTLPQNNTAPLSLKRCQH